jgi:hypothetical protein
MMEHQGPKNVAFEFCVHLCVTIVETGLKEVTIEVCTA